MTMMTTTMKPIFFINIFILMQYITFAWMYINICNEYTACFRVISNSTAKPRHFFVRVRRRRTKNYRGWGAILLDIAGKHAIYPIYFQFSPKIQYRSCFTTKLERAARRKIKAVHITRWINYLFKIWFFNSLLLLQKWNELKLPRKMMQ